MGSYGKFAATTRLEQYPNENRYVIRITEDGERDALCRAIVKINTLTNTVAAVQIERALSASPTVSPAADEIIKIAEIEVNAIPGLPMYITLPGATATSADGA